MAAEDCPKVKLQVERLPDLQIPRGDHSVIVAGGCPMVVGGHTSGFVPTATAEYYSDGEWHLLETVYPHDHGFSVPLRSGQVLIGGGHFEPLGIGHIHSVEMYDPATHTFRGFGCLDTKRCFATAVETDSGRVVITGNWYRADDMELFDGQKFFTHLGQVSQARACPYIFRMCDDVVVFGNMDEHAEPFDTIIVDRLKGEPFRVPLFDEWKPLRTLIETYSDNHRVGDNAYIFPVINKAGQVAICRVENTDFALLPTTSPVPMEYDGDSIIYYKNVYVNRQAGSAYLFGWGNNKGRLFVLAIGLALAPSPITLYYTDPVEPFVWSQPMLTAEGNLLIAGGVQKNVDGSPDNFSPVATALLLPLNGPSEALLQAKGSRWWWLLLAAVLLALAAAALYLWRKRTTAMPSEEAKIDDSIEDYATYETLMQQICRLMDEERPYLDSNLKIADVATRLGSNVSYVSASINQQRGCSFIVFVNGYRVDAAKQLLRRHPDKKIAEVWAASGFANETSFFRTFKAATGMTPSEWRTKID